MEIPVFTDNLTILGDGTEIHPLRAVLGTPLQKIASGSQALNTNLIASGAADPVISIVAAGVLATDDVLADFSVDPTGTVGYLPGAMLTIVKFCTAGHVNFIVVNNTAAGITPGAVTLNWRVVR
jgi:hypothetical protein